MCNDPNRWIRKMWSSDLNRQSCCSARWTDTEYRNRRSLSVCSPKFEAQTPPNPSTKTVPNRRRRTTVRNCTQSAIIKSHSGGHHCKTFHATHQTQITSTDRDVTASLFGLWSLQCAATWRHVAYRQLMTLPCLHYRIHKRPSSDVISRQMISAVRKMWTGQSDSSGFWLQRDSDRPHTEDI